MCGLFLCSFAVLWILPAMMQAGHLLLISLSVCVRGVWIVEGNKVSQPIAEVN